MSISFIALEIGEKKSELSEGISEIWLVCHPFLCIFNAGSLDQLQPAQVFHLVGLNVSVAVRAPRTCLSGQREHGKGNRAYQNLMLKITELFSDEIYFHLPLIDTFTSYTSYLVTLSDKACNELKPPSRHVENTLS